MTILTQTLIITGIGMGLVFLGIILLWIMMELLVRLIKDKPEEPEMAVEAETRGERIEETALGGLKQKAAAIAVAFALSQPKQAPGRECEEPAGNQYSNWQTVQRSIARQQSQLSNRNSRGNAR